MARTSVPSNPAVPSRLGTLSATERRVWRAFPHGESVDLRTGDPAVDDPAAADCWPADRAVRGEVIAALLLGACPAAVGAVAALRLIGARITGELRIDHGQVSSLLLLQGCRFDGPIDLDGAVTESIDLRGCHLTTLSAYGAHVRGTLDLRDTVVTGGDRAVHADGIRIDGSLLAHQAVVTGAVNLINAQIGGRVTFIDAQLINTAPDGKSLNAGGMRVGRSLMAQGLRTAGELRIPGAHIGSSLLLTGATLDGLGRSALHGEALTVASEVSFRPRRAEGEEPRYFTAVGSVRVPGARFGSDLQLSGARLTPAAGEPALQADRVVVQGSLHLDAGFRTEGEIELTGARVAGHLELTGMDSPNALLTLYAASVEGGIRDELDAWPCRLNLDGFTYGPFGEYVEATRRLPLLRRQIQRSDGMVGGFRAQPYEQLAAYYRSLGNDGEARTVLLAKQRALRAKLPWWRRIPGHLLDLAVGYGYRPLRAIGWAIGLLAASSAYFSRVTPVRVNTEDSSVFNPVLYAADHLVPVIRFGQPDVWQYHGAPAVVTAVLTVLGWTLGIAIAAAATRTFTRN
ncbi:oxidoreductase [Kitasatospora atroaurantiaca]|uniref:Membrane-associated oxidoreductase n=1 Tax=Kitasatospora atroaurantiaca TaxID=285545 RepID=A0A561EKF5_9ACTN|nr:pentapeptide repeat-containing protein [Kitasatospora atroaurantiaca]TWE16105.1 hypothetical protein FB465_1065 [Kitasatospora atroaurantiaca]